MIALFIILLAFFPSAITSPIPDGTVNPDIVDPTNSASLDVALANFASKEDPLVKAIDEDSTYNESTLTDPELVASSPTCDIGSQSQGYFQPTGELSTDTSSSTPVTLAAAVQRGSCPNPAQGSGNSADHPDASQEAVPTERDRQYNEYSERKRKSCCQLQPRETVTVPGNSVPLVNYGVCRRYDRNHPLCKNPVNWFLCHKIYFRTIFNRMSERVLSNDDKYGWGQYCVPGLLETYD